MRRFKPRSVLLVLIASMLSPLGGLAAESATLVEFSIPAQPLSTALIEFAKQANIQVLTSGQAIEGITAERVNGRLTLGNALRRLLKGSGFTYRFLDSKTLILVRDADGNAKPLALLQGTGESERVEGVPPLPVEDERAAKSQKRPVAEEIIVTGSRLRRDSDGPVAVTTFDRSTINNLGAASVSDVLSYLPQQSFMPGEEFNTAGSRFAQLRGLGLGTTLVLINGRRAVTSAVQSARNTFDLNAIPLAAVERIEVLSDSASAVYGADAVGGVVNVILRDDIAEPTMSFRYGGSGGGGDERRASLAIGNGDDRRLHGSILLDFFERDPLLGAERDFFANQDFMRFGGADRRVVTGNPGNISSTSSANLPGLPSTFAAVPVGSSGVGLTPASFLATAGQRNRESLAAFSTVVPESERYSGFATGEWELAPNLSVFGELMYTEREETRGRTPATLSAVTVPATNAFNPFGVAVRVDYAFEGIGPMTDVARSHTWRGVLGARGAAGEWDWEVSLLDVVDRANTRVLNNVNTAARNAALASADPNTALNVFQDGPGGSPTLLQSLIAAPTPNRFAIDAQQALAFARGPLIPLPAGSLQAVVGGEVRREDMLFTVASGNVDEDRDSSSLFVEFQVPIADAQMGFPLTHSFGLTLAARYDRYNDFGSTFNPQIGLEWRPEADFLVRANYSTSFRAPGLVELYLPVSTFPNSPAVDPRRGNETVLVTQEFGGNPDLDPEDSEGWSAGIVYAPSGLRGARFEAGYWHVEQDPRIILPGLQSIIAAEAFFTDRVTRAAPTPADVAAGFPGRILTVDATNLNAGRLETSGVDVKATASFATPIGRIAPTLSGTFVSGYRAAAFPNTPFLDRVGVADTSGTIPEWRVVGSLSWEKGAFSVFGAARYNSANDDVTNLNVRNGRTVPSQTLCDVKASIDLSGVFKVLASRDVRFSIGAINAFDEGPNYAEVGGTRGYDPSLSDVRQRFVYAELAASF